MGFNTLLLENLKKENKESIKNLTLKKTTNSFDTIVKTIILLIVFMIRAIQITIYQIGILLDKLLPFSVSYYIITFVLILNYIIEIIKKNVVKLLSFLFIK